MNALNSLRRFWKRRRKSILSSDAAGDLLTRVARADNAVEHGALAPDRARAVFEAALAEALARNAVEAAARTGKRDLWLFGRYGRRGSILGVATAVAGVAVFVATERNHRAGETASVAETPGVGDADLGRALLRPLAMPGSGLATAHSDAPLSPFTPPRSSGWMPVSTKRAVKSLEPNSAPAVLAVHHPAAPPHRRANVVPAFDAADFDDALTSSSSADDMGNGSPVTYCGVEFPATFSVVPDAEGAENESAIAAAGDEVTAVPATDPSVFGVLSSQNVAPETVAVGNPDAAPLIEDEEPRLVISVSRSNDKSDNADASHDARASWGGVVTARRILSGDREAASVGYAEASRVYEDDSLANRNPVAVTLAPVGGAPSVFANATWMRCVVRGTDIPRVLVARLPVNPDRSLAASMSGPADAR